MGLRRTKLDENNATIFILIRVPSLACGAAKPTVFPSSVAIFAGDLNACYYRNRRMANGSSWGQDWIVGNFRGG